MTLSPSVAADGQQLTQDRPPMAAGQDGRPRRRELLTMTPSEVVPLANRWLARSLAARRHVEEQTLLNLSFYLGQQYVQLVVQGDYRRITQVQRKENRVRTVDNQVDPAVRREVARLLRTRPYGSVIPIGDDDMDYEAARGAEDILSYLQRIHEMENSLEDTVWWSIVGGTGHFGVAWDPFAQAPDGQTGSIVYRVLSPFEFAIPYNDRTAIDDQPYVVVTKVFDTDEIEEKWGRRVAPNHGTTVKSVTDRLQSIVSSQARDRAGTGGATSVHAQHHDRAVVTEFWVKPQPMAPEGVVLFTSGDTVLRAMPWPAWASSYPFAKVPYSKVPGAYWGKALVTDLIPLQRRHNRAASALVESLILTSSMPIAVPRNTQVKSVLQGRATLFETPAGSTTPVVNISPPPLGQLPVIEMDLTRQSIADLSSAHETSKGQTPPNVRSGTAIATLKELDDATSAITIRAIERAVERIGRATLEIVRTQWDEPRMVLVIGDDGDLERRAFLAGNQVGGHYWVEPGSAFPFSKQARQQQVMELFQFGIIGAADVLRLMELGRPRKVLHERGLNLRHARRENQKFELMRVVQENEAGQMVPKDPRQIQAEIAALLPEDWHDHIVHLEIHNNIRKTPRYERWPAWKKAALGAHIAGHQVALRIQMQEALREQASVGANAPGLMEAAQQAAVQAAVQAAPQQAAAAGGGGANEAFGQPVQP